MSKPFIVSVTLKNFKKHKDLSLDFSESVNAIMGPNWAGKSSVIQAILFCLVSVSAVPGGKAKVARRGGGKTEVTLVLSDGVKIFRTLTTASVLNAEGDLVASGHTAVNQWVEDNLFGMPARQALALSYAPQSETAALLTLGAPALNRMIEELARADYVERLAAKSAEEAKASAAILGSMPDAADLDALAAKVAASESDLKVAEQALTHAEKVQEDRECLLAKARSRVTEAIAIQEKLRDRDALKARLEQAVEQLAESRLKVILKVDTAPMLKANSEALANLSEIKAAQSDIEGLKRTEEQCCQWLESNPVPDPEETRAVREALAKHEEALEANNLALAEREAALSEVRRALAAKREEQRSAVCSECRRPFDAAALAAASEAVDRLTLEEVEAKGLVEGLEAESRTLRAEIAGLKSKLPSESLLASRAAKLEQLEQARASLGQFTEWLVAFCEDLKVRAGSVEQAVEAIALTVEETRSKLDAARKQNTLAEAAEEAQTRAQSLVDRLERELGALKGLETPDLEGLRSSETKASEDAGKARDAKTSALEAVKTERLKVEGAKADLETAKEDAQRRGALERRAAKLSALTKWLRESKSKFLTDIWSGILSVTSEFVSLATDGYAGGVSRNDDGDFSLVEDGEECPMVGASGGMRAICATGLRIGLGSLLPQGLGFLLLDEPSSELNDENAAGLAAALRVQGHQVILVTHRDGEQFASDQTINLA